MGDVIAWTKDVFAAFGALCFILLTVGLATGVVKFVPTWYGRE